MAAGVDLDHDGPQVNIFEHLRIGQRLLTEPVMDRKRKGNEFASMARFIDNLEIQDEIDIV